MSHSTPCQIWGLWYLPRFLFNGVYVHGLFDGSTDTLWFHAHYGEVVQFDDVSCSLGMIKDGGGGPEMLFVLLPKFLPVSPTYTMIHPGWSHRYLYMTPPTLQMLSLSLGATNNYLAVLVSLKCTCIPAFLYIFLKPFTEPFGIWDYCENIIVFICVPVEVVVGAVPLLLT